jgi:hypothetical protein
MVGFADQDYLLGKNAMLLEDLPGKSGVFEGIGSLVFPEDGFRQEPESRPRVQAQFLQT